MVSAVRRGKPLREVSRRFRVSVSTVHYWVDRAEGQRLTRVDWRDRSHRPHHIRRTKRSIENLILKVRTQLKDVSTLGEYGAQAIRGELAASGVAALPALRTIGRILERRRFGRPRSKTSSATSKRLVFARGGSSKKRAG